MRVFKFQSAVVIAALIGLVACQSAPAPASPAATAVPTASGNSQAWDQLVSAAQAEGELDLLAPPAGDPLKQVLADDFTKQFGIPVNYFAANGGQIIARVQQEESAQQYLWDVLVGGTTGLFTTLIPSGSLQPLEPVLLPEIKDPSVWLANKLWFADQGHTTIVLGLGNRAAFAVNASQVNSDQFTSYKDLLDPRWAGQIGIGRDPRQGGPGTGDFLMFYANKDLGPDFIRALGRQNITIFTDDVQALDALGQGKLSILLSPDVANTQDMIQKGVPIKVIPPQQMKEAGELSPGPAAMSLFSHAPHPHAAQLYANWILSQEPQLALSKVLGIPSLRVDAPNPALPAWLTPVPTYIETYTDQGVAPMKQMVSVFNEATPSIAPAPTGQAASPLTLKRGVGHGQDSATLRRVRNRQPSEVRTSASCITPNAASVGAAPAPRLTRRL